MTYPNLINFFRQKLIKNISLIFFSIIYRPLLARQLLLQQLLDLAPHMNMMKKITINTRIKATHFRLLLLQLPVMEVFQQTLILIIIQGLQFDDFFFIFSNFFEGKFSISRIFLDTKKIPAVAG